MMSHKAYQTLAATVSMGEARILQAPQSDVSLDIPHNSPGIYIMHIETGLSETTEEIPGNECLISPVVAVNFEQLKTSKDLQRPMGLCTLNMPHCMRNNYTQSEVKVHHISSWQGNVAREVFTRTGHEPRHGTFIVHDQIICIHTSSFSKFICTNCKKTSCNSSVLSFLFARFKAWPEQNRTTVDFKLFLSSHLYRIKDFVNVNTPYFVFQPFVRIRPSFWSTDQRHLGQYENLAPKLDPVSCTFVWIYLQVLVQRMETVRMSIVEEGEVPLDIQTTDLSASHVMMKVVARSEEWGPELPDPLWNEEEAAFVKVWKTTGCVIQNAFFVLDTVTMLCFCMFLVCNSLTWRNNFCFVFCRALAFLKPFLWMVVTLADLIPTQDQPW